MTSPPNHRPRLSDHAYGALHAAIIGGSLPPGARIAEPEWAEKLGISRTPVREALLQLVQDGLVTVQPQSGSFVAPISLEAVREAQFVREHLECAVIREVAGHRAPADLARLRALLLRQQQAVSAGDANLFAGLDEEMHAAFCAIAGRSGVWRLIQRSKSHLDRVRRLSLPIPDQMPRLLSQHRQVVDAVDAADTDAAEAALRTHLREVFATIEALRLDQPS